MIVRPQHVISLAVTFAALAACGGPGATPADYNELAAHPFIVTESSVQLDLAPIPVVEREARIHAFAAARPNDGSSFTIAADAGTTIGIRRMLLAEGVAAVDIRTSPAAGLSLTRLDRIAHAEGCDAAPKPAFRPDLVDDGYSRSNANSTLLGCAVRRNIAAMIADPRKLFVESPSDGRDGARGAGVYDKWSKGGATAAASEAQATAADITSAPKGPADGSPGGFQ